MEGPVVVAPVAAGAPAASTPVVAPSIAVESVAPVVSVSPAEPPKSLKSDANADVVVAELRVGSLPLPVVPSGHHALHSDWTLWFGKKRKPSKQAPEGAKEEPYEASLLELARVASLEQFWSVFRWLKPIRGLARDSSFFVFRGAAQPLWENWMAGGCIIVKLKKTVDNIDALWHELVVCAIGESFMEPTVVGVAVGTRAKETYLSIWLSTPNVRTRTRITEIVQRLLAVPATSLEYKKHTLSMEDKSTYRNAERLSKKSDRKSVKGRPSQKRDERVSGKREPGAPVVPVAAAAAAAPEANK